jgi:hypothetical protein
MSLDTRAVRLPAELQLAVARGMGRNATIGEWCQFQRESRGWSVKFDTLFAEWLFLQPSKSWFWHFAGNEEEVAFVAEHADSECTTFYYDGSSADEGSAA